MESESLGLLLVRNSHSKHVRPDKEIAQLYFLQATPAV